MLGSLSALTKGSFSSVEDFDFSTQCPQHFQLSFRSLLQAIKAVNTQPQDKAARAQLSAAINAILSLASRVFLLSHSISLQDIYQQQSDLFGTLSKLVLELRSSPANSDSFSHTLATCASYSFLLTDGIRFYSLGQQIDTNVHINIFEQTSELEALIEGMFYYFLVPLLLFYINLIFFLKKKKKKTKLI